MKGCNCGTVHKDAHAPGCSGFAVEADALRRDNARLRDALVKFMEDENWQANTGHRLSFPTDAYRLGEAALKETKP